MVTVASVMLVYWWLQFTDTPLYAMCVVTCILTSNINVYNTEESSPYTASCAEGAVYKMAASTTHGLNSY
jgi:hypothetical protein